MPTKLEWEETPYGVREAKYKGFVITDSDGSYYPKGISVDIYGDITLVDSIKDAIRIIQDRKKEEVMSTFYGQVEGFSPTIASRRGSDSIRSSAQSWTGSVSTRLCYNKLGQLMVQIDLAKDSKMYGDSDLPRFYGTFEDLKECFRDWNEREVIE